MSPKQKDAKVPKPVEAARKKLADAGVSLDNLDGDQLRAALSPDDYDRLQSNLRTTLAKMEKDKGQADFKKNQYSCLDNTQKGEVLAKYVLDPQSGGCTGMNQTTVVDHNLNTKRSKWVPGWSLSFVIKPCPAFLDT